MKHQKMNGINGTDETSTMNRRVYS